MSHTIKNVIPRGLKRKGPPTNNIIFYLAIIQLFISILLYPQSTDIYFDQIFHNQGLSQSIVKCILQDKQGLMYFGTEDGLNIYDGYKFTILRNNPNDTNSISYNDITALFEDHDGIIWIGTFNSGLNRYDPSTRKINRFVNDPANYNSLSNNIIYAITEDHQGNLWIGTDNGLCRMEKNKLSNASYKFTRYYHDVNNKGSLAGNSIQSLLNDHSGKIWVGTSDGLNKINMTGASPEFISIKAGNDKKNVTGHNLIRTIYEDKRRNIWVGTDNGVVCLLNPGDKQTDPESITYQHNPRYPNSISHNEIYAVNEDDSGIIWIGTNGGGLDLLDPKTGKFNHFRHDPFNASSLCYNEIRCIYKNSSGIMWIGTYGSGMSKVSRGGGQFYHYIFRPGDPACLSHSIVWSIYEDSDSVLWIGTHAGLDRLDRKNSKYTHYKNNPSDPHSLSANVIRVITADESGSLWIGTQGGGISIFNKQTARCRIFRHNPIDPGSLSSDQIRAIFRARDGTIWVGTYGNGLDCFDQAKGNFIHFRNIPGNNESVSNDYIRSIFEDRAGNLWIGTEGGGLNKFDRKTGKFKSYIHDPRNVNSLSSNHIFSIHEDKDGYFWLGTWGGGLNKFDPVTEKFQRFDERNGLPSNSIYAVLEDNFGNLWLSTNAGLSKYDLKTGTFTNYNVKDGLQDDEFNGGAYFKGKNGELYFGGINGFNSFHPDRIRSNHHIPPVIITSFSKLNKEVDFGYPVSEVKEIELSYKDYVFAFEFSALDYMAPAKNQYAYRMEGLDKNWNFVDASKRFANYTTLSPGEYVFMVKASNSDGIWNDKGVSVRLIITPPFWKTEWFTVLVILLLICLAYFLYKRRLKIIGMKIELKAAHDAQMSIMPNADPVFEGLDISGICIPANEVGGDFFDYFQRDGGENKPGILIGDVSGKAMKAAMTAVLASGMILTATQEEEYIKSAFNRVNRILYLKTDKRVFVAACILIVDVYNNNINYVNAGNINPLIKKNGTVLTLVSSDPRFPLGMIRDVHYEENCFEFNPGDILFLITDGIVEAQSKSKDLYGIERLRGLIEGTDLNELPASEIKKIIIRDIERFSGNKTFHDDMTIIVVKRI